MTGFTAFFGCGFTAFFCGCGSLNQVLFFNAMVILTVSKVLLRTVFFFWPRVVATTATRRAWAKNMINRNRFMVERIGRLSWLVGLTSLVSNNNERVL